MLMFRTDGESLKESGPAWRDTDPAGRKIDANAQTLTIARPLGERLHEVAVLGLADKIAQPPGFAEASALALALAFAEGVFDSSAGAALAGAWAYFSGTFFVCQQGHCFMVYLQRPSSQN